MAGIIHFEAFLIAGILLNLTPGNDTMFILSKSIAQGKKAGILSAVGIATGSLIHTTFAALGLSLIIARSLVLFTIIKFAGAAYLVFVGCSMIVTAATIVSEGKVARSALTPRRIYRDAVLTNVLNPKVAMFFIAFLPQFVDPNHQSTVLPFLLLGISFTITGTIWCLILASFSSFIFLKLREKPSFSKWLNRICGTVLVGLGIRLALIGRK